MATSPPHGPPNTPTRLAGSRQSNPNRVTSHRRESESLASLLDPSFADLSLADPSYLMQLNAPRSPAIQNPPESPEYDEPRQFQHLEDSPPPAHSQQCFIRDLPEETLNLLRSLEYVSPVNENLLCPICQVAMVNPITTVCDHVFCRDCLHQAYLVSQTCPVDRCRLDVPQDLRPTHRLILNQLDGLEVRCPNANEGCQQVLARSMVQHHVEKYCGQTLVSCRDESCDGKVPRKDISCGCLHYSSVCPDCSEAVMELNMSRHRSEECTKRKVNCKECGVVILRCRTGEHNDSCKEIETACMWATYGCKYKSRRKYLSRHASLCDFKVMGPVVDSLKEEINSLRSEVQLLNEKDRSKERRIKFLEGERHIGQMNDLGYPVRRMSGSSMENSTFDSRDEYLLSLLESQENKTDQISLGMTELEAKHTMMLFNETIPIKEQLAELRSTQGVLAMHVRWLMNIRLQEKAAAGPSNEPKSGGSGQDFQPMRRSSDTMRDLITKL